MPQKRKHHFRFAGARLANKAPIQNSAASTAILTFVCKRCGERRDYEYQQPRPIDSKGNTLKLRPFDECRA
jgi:hypothetical protein